MRRIGIALFALTLATSTSFAHYNMLLPDKPWANKGDKVTFAYQFGHPFEHELFDAPKPAALVVLTPKGGKETLEIDKFLKPIKKDGADGKKVTAWQFTYTPPERGDYTFMLDTPEINHEENSSIIDTVRVVLHVQTQNGWDAVHPFGRGHDIQPCTRPYGILPGMVFKGRVVRFDDSKLQNEPFGLGLDVEAEKYNEKPVKNLPADELITFKTKTDLNGYFVTTLPEPGWWGITALTGFDSVRQSKAPKKLVRFRTTMWVHVDEKK
jgi:cobalt/nickel transport protein